MKIRVNKALSAVALLTVVSSAMAANENVDIKVIGEIVPAACVPAVTGGGVFDYGSMSASKIAADDFTVLDKLTKNFTITCDAAVKVGIRMNDARQASAMLLPGVTLLGVNANKAITYGLGEAGGKKIGSYALQLSNVQLDGSGDDVTPIFAQNNDISTWFTFGVASSLGDVLNPLNSRINSWYTPKKGGTKPAAFKTLTGDLNVQAAINKGSELDLSQKITLDGLANIEVVYL